MKRVLDYIDNLVLNYHYKKLPEDVSVEAHEIYHKYLPEDFSLEGDENVYLYSKEGTLISEGYSRIVVGDYGAFIEISKSQINKTSLCAKKGEEYRYKNPKYRNLVKYFWYTTKDLSDCKIYFQQRRVVYADYKKDYFYISPYEVCVENH